MAARVAAYNEATGDEKPSSRMSRLTSNRCVFATSVRCEAASGVSKTRKRMRRCTMHETRSRHQPGGERSKHSLRDMHVSSLPDARMPIGRRRLAHASRDEGGEFRARRSLPGRGFTPGQGPRPRRRTSLRSERALGPRRNAHLAPPCHQGRPRMFVAFAARKAASGTFAARRAATLAGRAEAGVLKAKNTVPFGHRGPKQEQREPRLRLLLRGGYSPQSLQREASRGVRTNRSVVKCVLSGPE